MSRPSRWLTCLALGTICSLTVTAHAQQTGATAPPAQPTRGAQAAAPSAGLDPKRMSEILEKWSARTRNIQALHAKFTREDYADDWQSKTRYDGNAYVKAPNLVYLQFDKFDENGKPKPNERIVCSGPEVYQFLTDTKQVHVYPLAPEEQKRAVEEGPLPFLFNMDATKTRERYEIALLNENDKLHLIEIKPLNKADREAFSSAYIWLDRARLMPTKILLRDPANPKNTKTYQFQNEIELNVDVSATYFDAKAQWMQVRQAGWELVMHGPDGKPVTPDPNTRKTSGTGVTMPRAAVPQPAQAPAITPPRR